MHTIIMNDDKQLITSVRKIFYQRENMVDKIQFLFPEYYEDVNLTDCTVVLKYIDIGNVLHSEVLAKDSELYKGKFRCILPVNTKLSMFAGNIIVRINFLKIDSETGQTSEVLKTGESVLTILADNTIDCNSDITEKMIALQAKINEQERLVEELKATKADNIVLDNETHELHLTANDELIGNKISMNDFGDALVSSNSKDGLVTMIV